MCTPSVPTMLAGDFNAEVEEHPLRAAFSVHGWEDGLGGACTSAARTSGVCCGRTFQAAAAFRESDRAAAYRAVLAGSTPLD